MAPILFAIWQWRKAIVAGAVIICISLIGWRATVWHDSYERLPAIEAQLESETRCEPSSACAERAATLALEAAQEAAVRAAEAVQGAMQREEAAQAAAAEWRRKYRSAVQDDPDCREWSEQPIRCPL